MTILRSSGQLIALPVKNHASLCTGDSASLQLEIRGSKGNTRIVWSHGKSLLDDSEHYSLGENGAVLNLKNVLPPHAGKYYAVVTDGVNTEKATFSVEVHGKMMTGTHPVTGNSDNFSRFA